MKTWWAVAFGVVGGLLGAGLILLISRPPRGEPITLLPPPTEAPILVYVVGAVTNPGVYHLPADGRVEDAIQSAGGLLPNANPVSLNLAAFLQDGERITIPTRPPNTPTALPPDYLTAQPPDQRAPQLPTPNVSGLININTATLEELDRLPGIGPVTAQKIISYREANGPFKTIENIQDVSGIGPATFARIKDLITVGEP